ncbi:PIN domain-containing protein [Rhodococcoides yunnanense]|jgi:predicted nucleic acid-binding protein|uniref:PIN domain-containing protein n=1 Tax=Rhodococcoides yunnanense TaxID=278209 RepID=UPI0022B1CDB3|nr:PIN domain-containing protein [Rhodococcus yunnanensis]MCZ4275316.1 PIN domain-containing protein [Rhodococcus yunnanensis]
MFAAVLDTCVLWPSLQRDFLLSLAVENLYRPLWSDAILDELEFHEARKLMERGTDEVEAAQRAKRLVQTMSSAFDDARVVEWETLDGSFGLPDPDDEHLVAAAVVGGAEATVSDNIKDLPRGKVPAHIQVIKPADFAANTVAVSPDTAIRALKTMSSRYSNPPLSSADALEIVNSRYGMSEAVELMKSSGSSW